MATVVEKLVSELKWDTNRTELAKARGDADKLKAATKQLEDEQRKSGKTTHKLREEMQNLRVALNAGLITQADFKKKTAATRLALADESLEARRASMALRELRDAHASTAKAARVHERAEEAAARAIAKTRNASARKAGRAQAASSAKATAGLTRSGAAGASFVGNIAANAVTGIARGAIDAIGDAMVASAAKAIQFESAMADVAKVVDGLKTPTGETTAAYHALTEELKTLSTRIAVAPEGLAEMAAAAGQAGIKGNELTRFVEDAAKTMVAFDITSEEAGNGLAKLRANLALDQDEVVQLAGTMNVLSNSMASTAAEVLDATLRVGAVGKAANVSGQEVAGLASAMIASGATSEIAATATKNFILSMSAGVAATRRQREAFARLGLSSSDVAKQFTGTAEQRLAISRKVIESMGKLSNADRAATSMQLFGRESLGPIASLTTDLRKFDDAMRLATDSQAAATSVQKEYEVRSNTTANALQLLKNRVSVVAIEIGEGMMPALREIIAEMGDWLGAAKASGKGVGEILGGALKRAWAALKDFIGPASELPAKISAIVDKAVAFADAVIMVVGALASVPGQLTMIGVAAAAMLGPYGAVLAISTALGAYLTTEGLSAWDRQAESMLQMQENMGGVARSLAAGEPALNETANIMMQLSTAADENTRAFSEWMLSIIGTQEQLDIFHAKEREHLMRAGKLKEDAGRKDYVKNKQATDAARADKAAADARTGQHESRVGAARGMDADAGNAADLARFAQLKAKGRVRTPSENTEFTALSQKLDKSKNRPGRGGGRSKKDMSAYEQTVEGEIDRLSKEAGQRAGIKAGVGKQGRAESYKAAKVAEEATRKQLRERVDAGAPLPGQFHNSLLASAGFNDVANRGTPPPVAVSIVKVEPPVVTVTFSGPISGDPREMRQMITDVFHQQLPQELAAGIREAKLSIVY